MFNSKMPDSADLPSSKQLLRSTAIAIVVASALLMFVVLPAEYGIDPTGFGKVIGLTAMGDIKVSLEEEANKPAESVAAQTPAKINIPQNSEAVAAQKRETKQAPIKAAVQNKDERRFTLKPGAAAEIKLEMKKNSITRFEWVASGGKLNHDTHGDPYVSDGTFKSYRKGRMVAGDKGKLKAAFDGYHGWFWRNRDKNPVTVVLKTDGAYIAIKRVM